MANTYTQLIIHAVFAVKYRDAVIDNSFKQRLYKYIAAIIQNNHHKLLSIGGVEDHIHILFGLNPSESISSIMMKIKRDSSMWINTNHLTKRHFQWQSGYGAFSVSKSAIDKTVKYINNQETHHRKTSFRDETIKILQSLEIDYNIQFIFSNLE